MSEDEKFVDLVGRWVSGFDRTGKSLLSLKEQAQLKELSYIFFPDSARVQVSKRPLVRSIAVGFDTVDPILDFLDNKTFKLKRKLRSNLFESWSRRASVSEFYMNPSMEEMDPFDPSKPRNKLYAMGLMFQHKFKPDEIILYLGSRSINSELGRKMTQAISKELDGIAKRSDQSEVLVDAYEANIIALCKNVKRFSLSKKTLRREPVVYEELINRLPTTQDVQTLKQQYKKFKHDHQVFTFICNRNGTIKPLNK